MKKKYLLLLIFIPIMSSCSDNSPLKFKSSLAKSQVSKKNDNYTQEYATGESDNRYYKSTLTINGRKTIWKVDVKKESELSILYNFIELEGKMTLLITDNDNHGFFKIIKSINNEKQEGDTSIKLSKNTYYFKLVGDHAKSNLSINLNYNEEDIIITTVDYLGDAMNFNNIIFSN